LTNEEQQVMEQYGITSEMKTIFHFQGHKYERLDDAPSYARKAGENTKSSANQPKK
jgi:hypothetical protein